MAWRSSVFAHTLVLGWGIALAAPAAWAKEGACFGGAPEVVARNQPMAGELRVQGRKLFWTSGGWIRSLDLAGGKVATVGAGETIRALDDDVLVSASPRNQLWLLDRRRGKARVLVDGRRHLEDALVQSSVGVYGGYVYFGRTAPDYRTQEAAGFFRVPIDGSREAERLAMEPDGQTPFVVARGDVVWVNVEPNGIVIHRRRLGALADAHRDERRPMAGRSLAAPATSANWATSVDLLKLVGDELFFTAGDAILERAARPARARARAGSDRDDAGVGPPTWWTWWRTERARTSSWTTRSAGRAWTAAQGPSWWSPRIDWARRAWRRTAAFSTGRRVTGTSSGPGPRPTRTSSGRRSWPGLPPSSPTARSTGMRSSWGTTSDARTSSVTGARAGRSGAAGGPVRGPRPAPGRAAAGSRASSRSRCRDSTAWACASRSAAGACARREAATYAVRRPARCWRPAGRCSVRQTRRPSLTAAAVAPARCPRPIATCSSARRSRAPWARRGGAAPATTATGSAPPMRWPNRRGRRWARGARPGVRSAPHTVA